MANTLNSNTFYVDTQSASSSDDLNEKGIKVAHVILTATGANARIVLQDVGTGTPTKLDLRLNSTNDALVQDFSGSPIVFPNGIKVSTLTNMLATLIVVRAGS